MPIIENYSDKHNRKMVVLAAIYVLAVAVIIVLLFNFFSRGITQINNNQSSSTTGEYICFEADVEQYLVDKVDEWAAENDEYETVEESTVSECNVLIKRNTNDPNDLIKLFDTTYVLVTNTPQEPLEESTTPPTNITGQELINALVTQSFGEYSLVWNTEANSFLRSNFNIGVGQIVLSDEDITKSLNSEESYIAIINLEDLTEAMTIIPIDEQSPRSESYNSAKYSLVDRYWIGGSDKDDIDTIYGILVEESDTGK